MLLVWSNTNRPEIVIKELSIKHKYTIYLAYCYAMESYKRHLYL